MRSRAGPDTKISVTGMKIFPYEHSSTGEWDETLKFDKITSLSQNSGQNGIIFAVLCISTSKAFISKVTGPQSYDSCER